MSVSRSFPQNALPVINRHLQSILNLLCPKNFYFRRCYLATGPHALLSVQSMFKLITAKVVQLYKQRRRLSTKGFSQMNSSVRFVIDFDETLTSSDTTSLIASLNSITMPQWKAFEKNYLDAFTKHSNLALSRALTTKSMHVYFNDMAEFESKAIKETINGLYLRNISTQQLRELARNIVPKEDMQAALNRLVDISGANPVHVLSLSWSKTVIKEFLSIHFPNKISNFVVHANELEVDSTGISTGNIIGGIHIAQDKANQVRQIRTETDVGDGSAKLVCIGDSLNDLLALLSADYGIILGQFSESSKLAQLCSIDHIRLAPITELRPAANIGKNKSIFVAENWTQVISALDKQH